MVQERHIHWLAPTSMLGSLSLAVIFAGSHHLFYSSLDGQPVSHTAFLNSPISKQEINTSVGLAFAFLFKASLVFAMSIAFIQLFWREVKAPLPGKPPTLKRVDSLHGVLGNVWALVDLRIWLRSPLPFMVAGLTWIVPIASIISPATLSIHMAAVNPAPESVMKVPNLDFGSLSFLAPLPYMDLHSGPEDMATYLYNGPSQAVLEVSNAVMAGGDILQIRPPASNASWGLAFEGPALKCHGVDPAMHQLFRKNIAAGMNASEGAELFGYLSWFPAFGWVGDNTTDALPFMSKSANGSLRFVPGDYAGAVAENITFYLAALPGIFGADSTDVIHAFNRPYASGPGIPTWVDGTMVECVLYHSIYHTSFEYLNGDQTITYNVSTGAKAIAQGTLLGPNPNNPGNDPCKDSGDLTEDQNAECYNDRNTLRDLSYLAIMDAFGNILKGSVYVDGLQHMHRQSNVLSTSLLDTQDLSFLKKAAAIQLGNNTLQALVASSETPKSKGLLNTDDEISTQPLHEAVEEIFQKITLSLMSSAALLPNYSSTSAPDPVRVTLPAYRTIYTYSALKLWATYGVAIFLASLAVLFGMIAMFLNGASYSGNFSTIYLASRGSQLSEKIDEQDLSAQDPLPKYLSEADVSFDCAVGDRRNRN